MLFEDLFTPMETPTKFAEVKRWGEAGHKEAASEFLREEYDFERARRHLGIEIKPGEREMKGAHRRRPVRAIGLRRAFLV
jgi:hypothetical protein